MKTNTKPRFSSLLFVLSLTWCLGLSNARPITSTTTALITEACSQSPNKDLCHKIIDSDHSSPRNNLNDVAFIAFDQTDNVATANIEFISQTITVSETASKDPATAAETKGFTVCDKQYEGASDAIDNAISALTTGTKGEKIENLLKDAVTAVETCQESVKGQQAGKAMQLEHMNQSLLDLLKNALSVFKVYMEKK